MLLSQDDLRPFQNHSTQMAALDYMVSAASDVFIPSYDGNMAKVVEGHRRFDLVLTDVLHIFSLTFESKTWNPQYDMVRGNVADN